MKKLLILLLAILISIGVMGQADKQTKPAAKPATTEQNKMKTHCYTMKDGAMIHCMGSTHEPMTKDVTLSNGTKVTTKGEVTMKDGKKTTLANGKAIDLNGKIGDFDKMHANMKKM
jgi:hypothetical protein